ncbi:hypothetical protein FRC08_016099 [Ceratobasidium sp. 394]|nr:hypothetical protein FRC08_016099 [Ceratobasidium sp. 394]
MPSFRWLPQETDWFTKISADHVRHLHTGLATHAFIERIRPFFLQQFPYRHPHYVNHVPHTQDEHATVLEGQSWWELEEPGDDVKLPPPSGLLRDNETTDAIRAELRFEGYREPDGQGPYSKDDDSRILAESLATRIHLWPETDCGAYTDEQRQWVLKDLPKDMIDLVHTLTHQTGAKIAILAAWKGPRGNLAIHSAASEGSKRWVTAQAEQSWVQYQIEENGQLLGSVSNDAPPRVYGCLDGSYKPWIPALAKDFMAFHRLRRDWLYYMYDFQALPHPIPWELGNEHPGDQRRLMNPRRLPPGWTHLKDPIDRTDDQAQDFVIHVISGQRESIPRDQKPQFLGNTRLEDDDGSVEWIAPSSPLRYGPESHLYVARVMKKTDNDNQVIAEVVNQFAFKRKPYLSVTEADAQHLLSLCDPNVQLQEIVKLMIMYEMLTPPQAHLEHYDELH